MAQIPLVAESPALNTTVPAYVAGTAQAFINTVQNNQTTLANRDKTIVAALEQLQDAIGNGVLTGGTIAAGTGLSVTVTALTALVGTWVGFNATQTVGGLTNAATNSLFLRQDGTWTVNTTGTPPLITDGHGDFLLWGTATTAGSAVSAVSNVRRTFLQNLAVMPLVTADPASPVTGDIWGRTDTSTIHVQGLGTFSVAGGGGTGNMTNRGTYDNTVTYVVGDVVQSSGSSFVCILSTVGHAPPNATYWNVLAQAGAAGATGATGAAGATGATGPAGAQGYTQRGTYNAGTTYAAYDVVQYNGSSYVAIGTTTGNLPTNATYWAVQASKGDTGATGAAGVNGTTTYSGTGVPSSGLGADGDFYYRTSTGDVYGKSGGAWAILFNITGPAGSPGPPGASNPIRDTFTIPFPGALTAGVDTMEFRIPDSWAIITFDRFSARLRVAGTTATTVVIEIYSGTGTFAATRSSQTFTIASGALDFTNSAPTALTVNGGDKMRVNITGAGSGVMDLMVEPTFSHV